MADPEKKSERARPCTCFSVDSEFFTFCPANKNLAGGGGALDSSHIWAFQEMSPTGFFLFTFYWIFKFGFLCSHLTKNLSEFELFTLNSRVHDPAPFRAKMDPARVFRHQYHLRVVVFLVYLMPPKKTVSNLFL